MDLGMRREAQISEESNTMYTLKKEKGKKKKNERQTKVRL
jgi:hypothetical protein